MTDAINPNHYRRGSVECIDAIEAATVDKRGIEAACTANIVKYLWRYEAKNGLEDVKKARWYLDRLISTLEARDLPPVGTPVEWPEDESRIDIIGQNGNDAAAYEIFAHVCCGAPLNGPHKLSCKGGRNG